MRISDWSSDVCSSDLHRYGRDDPGARRDTRRVRIDPHRHERAHGVGADVAGMAPTAGAFCEGGRGGGNGKKARWTIATSSVPGCAKGRAMALSRPTRSTRAPGMSGGEMPPETGRAQGRERVCEDV